INVQDNWDLRIFPDVRDGREHLGRSGAGFQSTLRGQLIDQTVRERITKRNAQLENVHAHAIKFQSQFVGNLQVRVAGADVHNKTFFAVAFQTSESFHNAVHAAGCSIKREKGKRKKWNSFLKEKGRKKLKALRPTFSFFLQSDVRPTPISSLQG